MSEEELQDHMQKATAKGREHIGQLIFNDWK